MSLIQQPDLFLTDLSGHIESPLYTHGFAPIEELRHAVTNLSKPEKVVLALDLGTTTGWALRSRDGTITSGTLSFKPGRFEGGGMRFLRFRNWLDELSTLVGGVGVVYFEEVRRHAGVDAAHAYGGFLGQLTAWCEQHQIPYQGVPVGTIKNHATGHGNASKAQMVAAVRARGHHPTDDNEADALALLHWAVTNQEVK